MLDSGATNHTTHNTKLLFIEENFTIKVANQSNVRVAGKGDIIILGVGKIEGVLFVPETPYNILATVKLSKDTNIVVTFRAGKAHMTKDGKSIGKIKIRGGLPYFKPGSTNQPSVNANTNMEEDPAPSEDEREREMEKERGTITKLTQTIAKTADQSMGINPH